MYIFFFIIGGIIFLISLLYFISSSSCLRDNKTFETLKQMLEEDGNYIPDDVLLDRIKKTFEISLLGLIFGFSMIVIGILFIIL